MGTKPTTALAGLWWVASHFNKHCGEEGGGGGRGYGPEDEGGVKTLTHL